MYWGLARARRGTRGDPRLFAAKGVPPVDAIVSLQWRAGERPGHLEILSPRARIESPSFISIT
jgi:hypothetical protein